MSFETITVEKNGPVGIVTLNRPASMNAVCAAMMYDLAEAFKQFEVEEAIRCVVIKGDETYFAAGTDMSEFAAKQSAELVKDGLYGQSVEQIEKFKKPIIAAVSGYAFGGGLELVLMSDIVIAAENARFGFPEMTLGVLPQMGGVTRLAGRVGRAKAMEMILTGRHVSADEALACGLVSRVVDTSDVVNEALMAAERVAMMPAAGVALAKQAVLIGSSCAQGAEKADESIARLSLMSVDAQEGLAALVEKRAPKFVHK